MQEEYEGLLVLLYFAGPLLYRKTRDVIHMYAGGVLEQQSTPAH